ncbi:MAG: long-chain fatty acid--CoA ligase, partial [Oscillospiraceae bacterium]|nr:long-chain fatty acid--CoA ligase [Candidatus Limimonas coprohippi]
VIKWNSFKSLYNAEDTIEGIEYKENKPVAIIYTSGTTGVPKGAQLTHDSINAVAFQYRYPFPYNRGDRFLDIMPPFIAYGLSCGIHMPLTLGLTLVIIPAFVPEEFPNYILKYKPNFFMGVPAHFEYIVTSEKMKDVDLSFVKVAAMGGDALNPDLELAIDKFLKDHNSSSKVYKGYGMTEMSAAAASTLSCINGEKFGSVGVPFQHNVVSVFEPGTDHELKYGEIGEFCICGPGMMYGYFNNDEETDKVLIKHSDGKIWAHTQDVGYIDEEGFIYFKDRIKRIFVRPDGHNVWPSVIESTVIKHDAVKDCAVVGLPNPKGKNGKIPAAFVVLKDGVERDKAEIEKELREICLKEIPERDGALLYYFIDEIPHTPIGKVDYRALENGDWEIGEYSL